MRTARAAAFGLALLCVSPAELDAQWLRHPTAGVPKGADGKPDLTAPAPRSADGKPDQAIVLDTELLEGICLENEKSVQRMIGK